MPVPILCGGNRRSSLRPSCRGVIDLPLLPLPGDPGRLQDGRQLPAYPRATTPMDDPEGMLPVPGGHHHIGQLFWRSGRAPTASCAKGDQRTGRCTPELPLGDLDTVHLGQGNAVGEAQYAPPDPAVSDPERSPAATEHRVPAAVGAPDRKADGDPAGIPCSHRRDRTADGLARGRYPARRHRRRAQRSPTSKISASVTGTCQNLSTGRKTPTRRIRR